MCAGVYGVLLRTEMFIIAGDFRRSHLFLTAEKGGGVRELIGLRVDDRVRGGGGGGDGGEHV